MCVLTAVTPAGVPAGRGTAYAERLFSDEAIRFLIAEGVQLAALLPTDRMRAKQMPPISNTLVPAMTMLSRLVRAHGVRAELHMTGGTNTQRNAKVLAGIQVGVVELSQRVTLVGLTHVFAFGCVFCSGRCVGTLVQQHQSVAPWHDRVLLLPCAVLL